ncbi:MAG: SCO family protein [Pseudomonadota bacterium]|nr:SCO family protein [Pseudomonadota bacterium]
MKLLHTVSLSLAGLALAACGQSPSTPSAGGAQAGCMTRAYDSIGGPINLVSHTGERVTEATFKGAPTLIYFGFTYCPDICPGTMVAVNRAYDLLPDGVAPPQTLLITVDPERDTPEAMAAYVETQAFPDNLVGLTGSKEDIEAAAEAFIVQYERIETPDSLAEYTMDHTSLLYLMDENWQLKTFFAEADASPAYVAECLAQHIG